MQAALITCIASNCAEPSAEAVSSGQVMRVNSALQSQTTDTLFTTILQQGIAVNIPVHALAPGADDIQLMLNSEETKKAGRDEAVDVCSLLMQLMVMNSADQSGGNNGGNTNADEKAMNGILSVINEISLTTGGTIPEGLDNAAAVILQNDGKAANILSVLSASDNTAASNNGQPKGSASGTQLDAVLAGITKALESEMKQNGAVQDVQAASTVAINEDMKTTAASRGINGNLPGAAINECSKTAGQPEGAVVPSADVTAEKVTSAGPAAKGNSTNSNTAGDNAESIIGERVSLERNRNDDAETIGNPVNQVLSETGFKGETMAEKTAAVERALDRFTDDIRNLRSGNQEIRIVLEPESLGVLIISVMKTESGISAKIKSEDKEVAAIISEHLQKLISSMQSKGITVDDVDVVYSQTEQNTSFTQHSFSQARDESSRGYTFSGDKNHDTDTSSNDIWQNFHSGETSSDTTVDYRV